jgi:anti-sigma factor RsiW
MTHPNDSTLQSWFDDALDATTSANTKAHIEACATCAARAHALRCLHTQVNVWAEGVLSPSDDLTDAIFARMNASEEKPQEPAKVIPFERASRKSSVRRFVFPAVAVAIAASALFGLKRMRDPEISGPVAQHTVTPHVDAHHAAPVEVGGGQGGAAVTVVDVQGAQSYSVLEVPGIAQGTTTSIVWIQESPDVGNASIGALPPSGAPK